MKKAILYIVFTFFYLFISSNAAFADLLQHVAFNKSLTLLKTIDPSEKPLYPYLSLDETYIDLAKRIALSPENELFWETLTYAETSPPLALVNQRVLSVVLVYLVQQNQTEKALLFFKKCPDERKFIVGKPVFIALLHAHQLNHAKTLISLLPPGFQTQLLMMNLVEAYYDHDRFEDALNILLPLPNSPQKQQLLTSILKQLLMRDLMSDLALTEYRSYLSADNDLILDLYQEQKAMLLEHSDEISTRAFSLKTPEQQEILLSQLVALYVQAKRTDEAVALISRVTHRPLKETLQLRLVKEQVAAKNRIEAMRAAQEIRQSNLNADAYFEIAKSIAKEDRFEEALMVMKQSKTQDFANAKFIELARLFALSPRFYTAAMALETLPQPIKDQALSAYVSQLASSNYEKARAYLPKIGSAKLRSTTEEQILTALLLSKRFDDANDLAANASQEAKPEKFLTIAEACYSVEGQSAAKEALERVKPLLPQITDPVRYMQLVKRLDSGFAQTNQPQARQEGLTSAAKLLKRIPETDPQWVLSTIALAQLYLENRSFSQAITLIKEVKDPLAKTKILTFWPEISVLNATQQAKWQKTIQKLK